jgi:hypothetical protein
MKKQGSILIEIVASLMIFTLTTTFIISTRIQNSNILKERVLSEEVNRAVYNLMNEFKYNIAREEIEQMLDNEKIGFKYDTDFSNQLLNTEVKNLEKGSDIEVSKEGEDDIGLKLKIHVNIKREQSEIDLEREFTKSWWMDEI